MVKQRSSCISLTTLILCLCIGILAILLVINAAGLSVPDISGVGAANTDPFDPIEFEEEFFVLAMFAVTIAGRVFSKSVPTQLGFQTACLSPVSPPPEYA